MKLVLGGLLLWFSQMAAPVAGQDFSQAGSERQMQSLTDEEKVKFINQHFYKLYSADFDNAVRLSTWAAETARARGWALEEARAQLGWGVILYLSGKYAEVLPHYFRSRHLYDSLGEKKGLADIHNELAVFYHKQKDLKNAWEALDISEKLAREINDLEALGTSLGHRGSFLSRQGKFTEAKPYYLEVYNIRTQTRDSVGLGYALTDLAEVALHEGRLEESLRYIDLSTTIRKRIGDKQGVAINFVNKGENYFQTGRYQQAAQSFEEGLQQSLAIGFDDLTRHTYEYLGKTYLALNDYRRAYALQEKFIAFKDSLFNIEQSRAIQELQTRYETEKKDRQISDLHKDNQLKEATIERNYFLIGGLLALLALVVALVYLWRIRERQRQQAVQNEQKIRLREAQMTAVIDSQEKERKRFASDLHDGMGQLMAALQLNIRSLRQSVGQPDQRDAYFESSEQLIKEVREEIRNIAFNLMPPVLVKEGLISALQELARKINKAGKIRVTITAFDLPDRFPHIIEVSMYRIVQEFLSNILKYGNATEVNISFTGFDQEVVLTLDDNGIGYNLERFKVSEGNGWRNIHSRLHLIKGTIEFDVVEGRQNNTIVINIPKNTAAAATPIAENTEQSV